MSTDTFAQLSNNLVYSSIAVFALAMLAYAAETARRTAGRPADRALVPAGAADPAHQHVDLDVDVDEHHQVDRIGAIATALTVLGSLLLLGGVASRGLAAQRAPWGNMYEFAIVGALAIAGAYLVFLRRDQVRELGVWVIALVLLTLGLAVTVLYTAAGALVPVLNSYWLVIHVAAALVAGGVFTVGAVAAVLYLSKERAQRRIAAGRKPSRYSQSLPSAAALDKVSHAAHLFAFPIWTFAVIAGAIWAENSWGRYWGWDPKETWAFITWVFYAAYLHAQSTAGWRGKRANVLALTGYLAFLFNFFGVNMWITGLHSYAGI